MALIKCSDCGKEISDEAEVCIYCGRPNEIRVRINNFSKSILNSSAGSTYLKFIERAMNFFTKK